MATINDIEDSEIIEAGDDSTVDSTVDETTVDEETVDETAAADTLKPNGGSGGAGDSKAQKIADLIGLLANMDNSHLQALHDEMNAVGNETSTMTGGSDGAANRGTIKAKASLAMGKVVKEDLEKLFGQDENLSEDFRNNATALFQGAVSMRVEAEVADLEEQVDGFIAEKTEEITEQFAERLDAYFAYVADKYITENQLAIENGLRAELSESFIEGIRDVFAQHYVDVPEEKIDVLEGYESQLAELEEALEEVTLRNIELTSVVESREKKAAIDALAEGMTDADTERLADILEDVDYNDLEDFASKAALIKENYFGEGAASVDTGLVLNETEGQTQAALIESEAKEIPEQMKQYVNAIKRDVKDNK